MDIDAVLSACQNPDANVRQSGEAALVGMVQTNLGAFLVTMCQYMADESKVVPNRQLAGLRMKQEVTGIDEAIIAAKTENWGRVDAGLRNQIKMGILHAIRSANRQVSHTAAQVAAAFGAIEMPRGLWPELIPQLLQNMTLPETPDVTKMATIEALGYLCDSVDPDAVDKSTVDQVLNAIVQGMSHSNVEIQRAATTALYNTIAFTAANFNIVAERNAIMQATFQAAQSADMQIKKTAFDCLIEIVDNYYEAIGSVEQYMNTIYTLTTGAMGDKTNADLARLGFEFWITVSEIESSCIDDGEQYCQLLKKVQKPLVDITLQSLVQLAGDGMEDVGEDDDDISSSAAFLLECMAQTLDANELNPMVLPAVYAGIGAPAWQMRYGALFAFKALIEAHQENEFQKTVAQAAPVIIGLTQASETLVKDAAYQVLAGICAHFVTQIDSASAPRLVQALMVGAQDASPMVATSACYCCSNLAEAFHVDASNPTGTMSGIIDQLMGQLFATTQRPDASENNLRSEAYMAINSLLNSAPTDKMETVFLALGEAMKRLESTFPSPGQAASPAMIDAQGLLCGVISVCVSRLPVERVLPVKDDIMQRMLYIFDSASQEGAQEEAFTICSTMLDKLGDNFVMYMTHFAPYLLRGIEGYDRAENCIMAITTVGEMCRSLNKAEVLKYSDDIMLRLNAVLQSTSAKKQLKHYAIEAFGDVAMAVEGKFVSYLQSVMEMMCQAGKIECRSDDEEDVEYFNSLREAILSAYTGILMGLAEEGQQDKIYYAVPQIVEFADDCRKHPKHSEDVLKGVIGILGDLADRLGSDKMSTFLKNQEVYNLLDHAGQNPKMRELADWARKMIQGV